MLIKTTCPRDCYDTCGMEVKIDEKGTLEIKGDPSHPYTRGSLCGKCMLAYNGVFLDPKKRLQAPLRRKGRKGEGVFEQISWDEALSEISCKLKDIANEDASKILHAHYTGTCSLIANKFPNRFFKHIGATEVEPDTVCNMAGHVALDYIIGTSLIGFDPRTSVDSSSIFVWGCNPSVTAPHAHMHWLKDSGAKIVVIDPIRHQSAERANLYLQLRPGSDAALVFAIINVLLEECMLDRSFLDKYTIGWDELKPLILKCSPSWGEKHTGIKKEDIITAAKIYGEGPSLLWLGQGLQRQKMGGNIIRSCALLPSLTGNFGKPGSGLLYLNGSGRKGVDSDYLSGSELGVSPPSISHMDLAKALESKDSAKAFICWNINPVVSNPEQARLRSAMSRSDLFNVVIDIFETDTTDYADYVLPAASFLEFNDLVSGYFNLSFSAQVKASEPMGQALPNQEIFRKLSKYMGFSESALYESDESIINKTLTSVGITGGFSVLSKEGTIWPTDQPVMQFPDLIFPTPSGKIELASSKAEADGFSRLPLPNVDCPAGLGKLRLITPASRWLMNGSYANDYGIKRKLGRPTVTINPKDAERLNLEEGAHVSLTNETGSINMYLCISDIVAQGVAMSVKGRWTRLKDGELNQANVNFLNSGVKSDMGSSNAVHSVEVTISRAT